MGVDVRELEYDPLRSQQEPHSGCQPSQGFKVPNKGLMPRGHSYPEQAPQKVTTAAAAMAMGSYGVAVTRAPAVPKPTITPIFGGNLGGRDEELSRRGPHGMTEVNCFPLFCLRSEDATAASPSIHATLLC